MNSALHSGWQAIPLGELTEEKSPICYGVLKPGDLDPSGIPMVRVKDIRNNVLDESNIYLIEPSLDAEFRRSRVRPGDLLISVQGTVGRVAIVPESLVNANISRTIARIRLRDLSLGPWVRFALLSSVMQRVIGDNIGGTTRDSLNIGDLRLIRIPIPPTEERERIVSLVDDQFQKIEQVREDIARANLLMRRFPPRVIATLLGAAGGHEFAISDLAEIVTGKTPPTQDEGNFGGDIPFVKPTDLDVGYVVQGARETLTVQGARFTRLLPAGSTLVTCIGATIGKTGYARIQCAANQQINALVPDHSKVDPRWLYWSAISDSFQEQIRSNASATTLPIINKSRFARLRMTVPGLETQRRVLTRLEGAIESSDEAARNVRRAADLCARLEQAILTKALRRALVDADDVVSTVKAIE